MKRQGSASRGQTGPFLELVTVVAEVNDTENAETFSWILKAVILNPEQCFCITAEGPI